jgi:hypothetical protein
VSRGAGRGGQEEETSMEWFLLACIAIGAFVMVPAFRNLVGALAGLALVGFLVVAGLGIAFFLLVYLVAR